MGLKFNPPPGWPLPWDFDPSPGWEPDPAWPAPPPNWPLWIGSDAPPPELTVDPRLSYVGRHSRQPSGARPAAPGREQPGPGYPAQPDRARSRRGPEPGGPSKLGRTGRTGRPGKPGQPGRRPRRSAVLKFAGATALATVVIAGGAVAAYRLFGTGTSTTVEPVSFSSLRPGACFQDPPGHRLARGPAVGVAAVPCTAAHSAQVIARFPLAGNRSYPGRSVLARLAARDCRASVTAIEKSKAGESARVLTLFPGPMAWRDGIRAISCVAVGESRDLSTSLVKMAGKGTPSSPGPSGAPRHATAPAQRKGGGSAGPAPKSHRP